MRRPIKRGQLVEVTWTDACSTHGWFSEDELRLATCHDMTTVGYLVRRSRTDIALAQTHVLDDETRGKWGEIWAIPAGWIKRVRRLK